MREDNKVTVRNILDDLLKVGPDTSTGQYGYGGDPNGELIVEVWNDDYHGTKKIYRVHVELEEIEL